MKQFLCAFLLCLSMPVSALPSGFVIAQGSLGLSAFCGWATSSGSISINDEAEKAKEELNRALQNLTCPSLNCTHLMIHDVKALHPMTNLQYNAWAASILQIIPDVALFLPILFVPYLIPKSQILVTALSAVLWVSGLGTWIAAFIYTRQAKEGIPSYCNNTCEDYKPYLDSTKFLDLQIRAENANIATTTAYKLSLAHGIIRILSAAIPMLAFGAYIHFCPRTAEGAPLNVQ